MDFHLLDWNIAVILATGSIILSLDRLGGIPFVWFSSAIAARKKYFDIRSCSAYASMHMHAIPYTRGAHTTILNIYHQSPRTRHDVKLRDILCILRICPATNNIIKIYETLQNNSLPSSIPHSVSTRRCQLNSL